MKFFQSVNHILFGVQKLCGQMRDDEEFRSKKKVEKERELNHKAKQNFNTNKSCEISQLFLLL